MATLPQAVARHVEAAGLAGTRLVAAVSGGPDSLALLHALHCLRDSHRLSLVRGARGPRPACHVRARRRLRARTRRSARASVHGRRRGRPPTARRLVLRGRGARCPLPGAGKRRGTRGRGGHRDGAHGGRPGGNGAAPRCAGRRSGWPSRHERPQRRAHRRRGGHPPLSTRCWASGAARPKPTAASSASRPSTTRPTTMSGSPAICFAWKRCRCWSG